MLMIWVDWLLFAALVVSILIGVIRGFTREVLGLATWILSLGAALLLAPYAAVHLEPYIAVPSVRIAAAYALVFFGGLVLGAIITAIVAALVRKSPLSGVDRTVGGGFGLVRGVLIAVVAVWLVGLTPARQDPWWGQSMLIGKLEWLAGGFESLMPEDWRARLKPAAVAAREGV
jgi:membrane protein required for colicin V production